MNFEKNFTRIRSRYRLYTIEIKNIISYTRSCQAVEASEISETPTIHAEIRFVNTSHSIFSTRHYLRHSTIYKYKVMKILRAHK